MSETLATAPNAFVDRRIPTTGQAPIIERRQFSNSHDDLSPDVRELAKAIDEYKLRHRRRFISYEEMYNVIRELGYHKD
ncbi:MAG: hypothetical protein KDA92_07465 [Planctomycetales bacterium]|nr:hypothetical protein [Planctomycetales bacterium]MCA9168910.1 hypothetical protein [Planctomycetales bacterium]